VENSSVSVQGFFTYYLSFFFNLKSPSPFCHVCTQLLRENCSNITVCYPFYPHSDYVICEVSLVVQSNLHSNTEKCQTAASSLGEYYSSWASCADEASVCVRVNVRASYHQFEHSPPRQCNLDPETCFQLIGRIHLIFRIWDGFWIFRCAVMQWLGVLFGIIWRKVPANMSRNWVF
jgi:hypothetical protein